MNLRIFVSIFLSAAFISSNSIAQKITLNDVAKIEFVKSGRAFGNDYGTVELVCENKVWNSYQTKSYLHYDKTMHPSADSTRTFLRTVPVEKVTQLLAIIGARPDSSIKFDAFAFDFSRMLPYADSTGLKLKADQRKQYIAALQSKSKIQEVIQRAFVPSWADTKNAYNITIISKTGKADTIHGLSYQNIYHMPWVIKGVKVYNPHLGEIYEYIKGNDKFAAVEIARMHDFISTDIYVKYFESKFAWQDLQTDDPLCYALLNDKKMPAFFSESKLGWYGAFEPARLPFYLHPYLRLKPGDTAAVMRFNRFEDTLAAACQKGNFLFDYLKRFPTCHVQALAGEAGKITPNTFYQIRTAYPDIERINYKQIQVLNVEISHPWIIAHWFLLPDNTLILQSCTGNINYDANSKFTGITPNAAYTGGYIVFDSSGKKIGGHDIFKHE